MSSTCVVSDFLRLWDLFSAMFRLQHSLKTAFSTSKARTKRVSPRVTLRGKHAGNYCAYGLPWQRTEIKENTAISLVKTYLLSGKSLRLHFFPRPSVIAPICAHRSCRVCAHIFSYSCVKFWTFMMASIEGERGRAMEKEKEGGREGENG